MSWDIYGNRLERGHCEVHPWIGEEYPCALCRIQTEESNRLNEHYQQVERQWQETVEAEHRHLQYMEYSDEYRNLHLREEKIKNLLLSIAKRKQEVINTIPF